MAITQISAPMWERTDRALSADNVVPDRFAVIEMLRLAAPSLGLKPPVLATLDALLSCLPPRRNHHMVFASNQTLVQRRDGISDRSLRRHCAALEEAGLITRQDSPNGKRFSRNDPKTGMALRFGFDLSPLFARFTELGKRAAEAKRQSEHLRCLRLELRTLLARHLEIDPDNVMALEAKKQLRRAANEADLTAEIARFALPVQPVSQSKIEPTETRSLSATGGHFVRHYQKSNTENIDKAENQPNQGDRTSEAKAVLDIPKLTATCPEALEFAVDPIRSPRDVIAHAKFLAPMLGIDQSCYKAAETLRGPEPTALTIWLLMSLGTKIRSFGAYFRAITLGARQRDFDPWALLDRRARIHG